MSDKSTLEHVKVIYNWVNLVCDMTFTVSIVAVICWFLVRRKGSDWPLHLKVQIALLLLMLAFFDFKDVWVIWDAIAYD